MIFTGFKRKSNQIFFNKRLTKFLEISENIISKEVKKVLIILDDISEKEFVKNDLLSLFNISEEKITILVFQHKAAKEPTNEEVISPADFGWYGKIKSDKLKAVLTNKYDLLINYSKVDNLYSNLLLLQCKAGFKAGFKHLDNRFYDLTIDCNPNDFELFNKELKKYLAILNKI